MFASWAKLSFVDTELQICSRVWMFTLTNNNNNGIEFVHVGACRALRKEKMKIAKI